MIAVRVAFFVLSLALFGGLNYFLYRRLIHDVTERLLLRRVGAVVIAGTVLVVPLSRLVWRHEPPPPMVSTVALWWWGVTLFALMALVALELVRAISRKVRPAMPGDRASGLAPTTTPVASVEAPPAPTVEDPARRVFLARATAAGALAFGGGLASFGAYRAFRPATITEMPVKLRGLPKALDGFTIVQLSDIHVGAIIQTAFLDQLVQVANSAKPDLVAITGDLVDGSPDVLGPFVARLRNLSSRHGTYFVSGNHDYYSDWEAWAPEVQRMGFTVLRNRFVSIGDAGGSFDLVGVDDWGSRMGRGGYDLGKATEGRDPSRASVLLAHQPNGLEYADEKGLGLQLSGHTHGGQIFPGNLVGDVIWGERNAGLCKLNDTYLYTSRGCGFVGPPVRVGAPPEVVKIVLVAS
jgi:predicted MPP superfamily phosphohydrolase